MTSSKCGEDEYALLSEVLIFLISLVAGSLGSMLGLGGGFFIVPALVLFLDFPMHEAVSLSLASICGIASSSFLIYAKSGTVNFKLGFSLEFFTFLGVLIGSIFANHLSSSFLEFLFGIVLIYVSFRMIKSPVKYKKNPTSRRTFSFAFAYFSSFIAGLIASMLGLGGGVLKVPIMTLILNVPIKMAIGTSELMITITSFTATMSYYLQGVGKIYYELFGLTGGFLGGQLGSRTSLKMKSPLLKKLFALVLGCLSVVMLIKATT